MVEWMREFNRSGKGQIEFTGFDMQMPAVAAAIVRNYVAEHDSMTVIKYDGRHALCDDHHRWRRSKKSCAIPHTDTDVVKVLCNLCEEIFAEQGRTGTSMRQLGHQTAATDGSSASGLITSITPCWPISVMNPSDEIEPRPLHTPPTPTQWAIPSICLYSGGRVKSRDHFRRAPGSVFGDERHSSPVFDLIVGFGVSCASVGRVS
jgi:hypothetical protein